MLRITEKEDFEARERDVEAAVEKWKTVLTRVPEQVQLEFRSKLMISIIYHDSALEGQVLGHSEIKASIDTSIISDSSLIPSYEDITNFNAAVTVALQLAKNPEKIPIRLSLIRQLYGILNPAAKAEDFAYRAANPLHRLYYHTIVPPPDVPDAMKKFDSWLGSSDCIDLNPIAKASQVHYRLMGIFPWLDQSGRLSRVLSMMILEQEGYPLPVLHSIDRQAYYESLRSSDADKLTRLYMEAVEVTASSSQRVYEEAASFGQAS